MRPPPGWVRTATPYAMLVLAVLIVGAMAGRVNYRRHNSPKPPVAIHYPAYCFPGGVWSVPGETMVHPCRTDMLLEM